MNRSQTKIRKIQEANKIAEERFLMSEQASPAPANPVAKTTNPAPANPVAKTTNPVPANPVANKIAQPDPTKKPVSKKLPTDYNKAVTFLFPDNTIAVVKPQKQDVSKSIIELLGIGTAPTNNVVNLSKVGGAQKTCGNNAFNKKVYIFTKPNKDINDWCSLSNINPDFMKNSGIFEIPYKPEFISIGTWQSAAPKAPQSPTQG
jgi:hypothetical protein